MYDFEDSSLLEYLQYLCKKQDLTETERGVLRQLFGKGFDSLSPAQKGVLERLVSKFSINECCICLDTISWEEMPDAFENGGRCSYCRKLFEE